MLTRALFFPFDLFGSPGTRAGAELLADAFQEMLADNRREKKPTRAKAYTSKVRFAEMRLDRLADYRNWRADARRDIRDVLKAGDFLLWITGNHLGVLPVYEELGRDTLVLQFDAHLDIYNLDDCAAELSHGNFLLHAQTLPRVVNVGQRELLLRPDYIGRYYEATISAAELILNEPACRDRIARLCAAASQVFLDIDVDVFDPAYFPGAAHPQPFGISPQQFLRLLEAAWSEKVVGLAVSEYDPARDRHDQGLATLMWLLEYVVLKIHER